MQALGKAQVVAFSQFACASTRAVADVILPIGALPEIDATLTNLDGRDQRAIAAGKMPGEARPGWRVLRALGGELDAAGFDFTDLVGLRGMLAQPSPRDAAGNSSVVAGRAWFQEDEVETVGRQHRRVRCRRRRGQPGTRSAAGGWSLSCRRRSIAPMRSYAAQLRCRRIR